MGSSGVGQCRCGRVRFEITGRPLFTSVCHCRGCQRMSGSAFSLTIGVPEGGVKVLGGELAIGGAHGADVHQHCAHCKSWMFTRPAGAGMVNVRATLLDDPSGFLPFLETCTAEKLPWVQVPAQHSYPGFPPMEDFGRLLEAFARG